MADRRDNKLQVKLELLKNSELDKLSNFSTAFAQSVSSLDRAMSSFADRVEKVVMGMESPKTGMRSISGTGVVPGSIGAHTGYEGTARINYDFGRSQQAGSFVPMAGVSGVSRQSGGAPAPASKTDSFDDEIFLGTFINNPMRAFTTQMAASQIFKRGISALPADGRFMQSKAGQFIAKNPQATVAAGFTLGGAYMGMNVGEGGYTGLARQTGLDIGVDRLGGFGALPGLNLFTAGGQQAAKARISDTLASLSPTISRQQLYEIRETLASMGMTEDPDGMLKRMTKRGYDLQTGASLLQTSRRFRPNEITSVESAMDNLASAASGAGESIKEFQRNALAAASEISRATGISSVSAMNNISEGAAYGLNAQETAGIMGSQKMRFMTMGMSSSGTMGQRYWDASHNVSSNINTIRKIASRVIPGIEDYQRLSRLAARGDKGAQDTVGRIDMIASQNPELFGGLTPQQLSSALDPSHAGAADARKALNSIVSAGDTTGLLGDRDRLRTLMRKAGVDKQDREKFFKHFNSDSSDKKLENLQKVLGHTGGVNDQRLGLTEDAKRLVKLMDKYDKGFTGQATKAAAMVARASVMSNPLAMPAFLANELR